MKTKNLSTSRDSISPRTLGVLNLLIFSLAWIGHTSPGMAAPGDVFIDKNGTRAVDKGGPVSGGNPGSSPTLAPGTTSIWDKMRKARENKATAAEEARLTEAYNANKQGNIFYEQKDWAKAIVQYQIALAKSPDDPVIRQNLNNAQASMANDRGLGFYNKKDWANALACFQEAANKCPDAAVFRQNIAYAQAQLQNQQAEAERQLRDKTAAANMQKAINSFTETLTAAQPTSGDLDFDGKAGGKVSGGGGLDFTSTFPPASAPRPAVSESGDPKVVDARKLPSGLSKAVDDAIVGSFKDAPPGVSDRVRKGFQAVADRDWKVAHAWFQDALNHDPNNAGLKNLVALSDPPDKTAPTKPVEKKPGLSEEDQRDFEGTAQALLRGTKMLITLNPLLVTPQRRALILAGETDVEKLFPDLKAWFKAHPRFAEGHVQLPEDSDMNLLFNDTGNTQPPPPNPGPGRN